VQRTTVQSAFVVTVFESMANVRLEANVASGFAPFSGRISSVPSPPSPRRPEPNHAFTMSSRPFVSFGAMVSGSCLPTSVPLACDGVNESSYSIGSPDAFTMRTSDWKRVPMPSACAIAGTSSVPGGAFGSRGAGVTGVTLLIVNGSARVFVPSVATPPLAAVPLTRVTTTVPVLEPTPRSAGLIVNCTVVPPADSAPDAGKTVSHGASVEIENVSVFVAISPKPGTR
jgi:hypothetical protein